MNRDTANIVYVGIKGTAIAIDRATGEKVWQTGLKGSDFVNLHLDGDDLFATTTGVVFCLDAINGTIRWNNGLSGFGFGLATIATAGSASHQAAIMAEYLRQQEQASRRFGSGSDVEPIPQNCVELMDKSPRTDIVVIDNCPPDPSRGPLVAHS